MERDGNMAKKNLPKLVMINWEDAISPTHGWTDIKDLRSQLADCISIGIVIAEDDKTITIVSHLSGDSSQTDIDGSLILDKSWIKDMVRIPVPRSMYSKLRSWITS